MHVIRDDRLKALSARIFSRLGASEEEARIVSEHLVDANLFGIDSHGVIRIPEYVRGIRAREIRLRVEPKILRKLGCTALVSGEFGLGQVTGLRAMNLAIETARSLGSGIVGIKDCNHLGRMGEYAMLALRNDMVGAVVAKGPALVAPFGGRSRMLGANPIAFGIPTNKENPIVLDFSTSAVAEGKLRVKRRRGESIPAGWVTDKNGRPTTDPSDFYNGGALLPFGGYKGYGLSVVIEALGGLLTGAGSLKKVDGINGALMIALNVESFSSVGEFKSAADGLIQGLRASPKEDGDAEILVPGELEFREYRRRSEHGIPIEDDTWSDIVEVATGLNVDPGEEEEPKS